MGRNRKSGLLNVYMNGELVGHWTIDARQEHTFRYSPDWLDTPHARPISLSLPLRPVNEPYRGPRVSNFFENLLPDRLETRQQIQARFQLPSSKPFTLLEQIGRDCVGAIQLSSSDEPPPDPRSIEGRPVGEEHIEQKLKDVPGSRPLAQRSATRDDFRISLAGAQEKTAFLQHQGQWWEPRGATPTTHIFKLPMGKTPHGIDLSTSVENEWICHKVLQAYGIPVADCARETFGSTRVLVVTRFDRRLAAQGDWIIRLPQEDFCQALAVPGALKYESDGGPGIETSMKLLLGSADPLADRRDFFRTQIVYWLLCAVDGHAKNFSIFLEPGGSYRLTPRYDVLSAYPAVAARQLSAHQAKMAMAVIGKNRHYNWREIRRSHWEETARRCGLGAQVKDLITELIERTPTVAAEVNAAVPADFPERVARPILEGLQKSALSLSPAL